MHDIFERLGSLREGDAAAPSDGRHVADVPLAGVLLYPMVISGEAAGAPGTGIRR